MKKTVKTPLEVASCLVEDRVRRYNGGSMPQDRTICGATEVVYVRGDLLSRLRAHPHLAIFAVPACEFEQLGKTLIGLAYISRYSWVRCNLESIFHDRLFLK